MNKMKVTISKTQLLALFSLIICIIVAMMGIGGVLVLIPLLIAMTFNRGTTAIEFIYCMLAGITLAFLRSAKIIEYPLFPQAATIYSRNNDLLYWFRTGHPHAIRLLISYPGIYIANRFSEEVTWGVTIYSISLLILIMYIMIKIIRINELENRISALLCGIAVVGLALVMNGRLIFTFWGVSLLCLYELKYKKGEVSVLILQIISAVAIIFSAVSSGNMFVTTAYVVLIMPFRWKKCRSSRERVFFVSIQFISLFPVIRIFVPYLLQMLRKNLNVFGGGFQGAINMMQHGLGKIFPTVSEGLTYLVLIVGVIIVIANIVLFEKLIIRKNNPNLPLFLIANVSLYASVFGLSAGLTAMIPVLILIVQRCR